MKYLVLDSAHQLVECCDTRELALASVELGAQDYNEDPASYEIYEVSAILEYKPPVVGATLEVKETFR